MAVKTSLFQAYRFQDFTPAQIKKMAKKAVKTRKSMEQRGASKGSIKNRLRLMQTDAWMNAKIEGKR